MIYFVKIFINDIIVQLLNESQANAFFTKLIFTKLSSLTSLQVSFN